MTGPVMVTDTDGKLIPLTIALGRFEAELNAMTFKIATGQSELEPHEREYIKRVIAMIDERLEQVAKACGEPDVEAKS